MSNAKTAAVIGAGLVGLFLLSGQGKNGSGGGFGGGGGTDREPSDTIINFPELDLSNLWGDSGVVEPKKVFEEPTLLPDSAWTQAGLDKWAAEQPWYKAALPGGEGIGDWFRAQPVSTKTRSNILNPQPMPYSIHDPSKKASYTHHGASILPDPVSLGLTPRRRPSSGGGGMTTRHGTLVSKAPVIKKKVVPSDYSHGGTYWY